MITINPDKYIRKAVYDLLNNIVVSGNIIKCYDARVYGNQNISNYIILANQMKNVDKATKCEYRWNGSIMIEIYTRSSSSRVLLNDIEQAVTDLLTPKISVENYEVIYQNITYVTQLESFTDTENIYRSFLTLELTLN
ncbi:hypothetical protein UFOVP638_7 [uncultured Caudovirales phage]|uniref:Tail completion protein n=1 Tax=uncultured Caudovirales phage TaxID=2100421 RepID=A0A6J5NDK2_9CAUD|nr:hypothetical protein UFOVP638_7 [uncultured Caudovirales phage]